MKKMLLFALPVILSITIISCSKDDDSQETGSDFALNALVNGKKFKSQGYGNILSEYKKLENGLYQLAIVASTEPDESNEYQRILIRVILPGPNYLNEDLGVTDNQNGSFSNPFAFYEEVEFGTELKLDYADTDITRISSFNITEIDLDDKTISGKFRFTAASTIFNKTYEVKEGTFNKITYKDLTNN